MRAAELKWQQFFVVCVCVCFMKGGGHIVARAHTRARLTKTNFRLDCFCSNLKVNFCAFAEMRFVLNQLFLIRFQLKYSLSNLMRERFLLFRNRLTRLAGTKAHNFAHNIIRVYTKHMPVLPRTFTLFLWRTDSKNKGWWNAIERLAASLASSKVCVLYIFCVHRHRISYHSNGNRSKQIVSLSLLLYFARVLCVHLLLSVGFDKEKRTKKIETPLIRLNTKLMLHLNLFTEIIRSEGNFYEIKLPIHAAASLLQPAIKCEMIH